MRQRQRDWPQKSIRFNYQNNNFARASRFFVHFFAVTARLRRENTEFPVLQCKHAATKFSFSLLLWIRLLGIQLQEGSHTFDKAGELELSR